MNITKNTDHRIIIFKQMEEEGNPVKGQEGTLKKEAMKNKMDYQMDSNGCFTLPTCLLTMSKNIYTVIINFLDYLLSGSAKYLSSINLKESIHITEKNRLHIDFKCS